MAEGTIQQLVNDVAHVTGASLPHVLEEDAPILREPKDAEGFYLIGLIGGKDVGKSALVNALVGERITQSTAFGPGTESVIAYAHESQVPSLRMLLEREVPWQYKIVPHSIDRLSRQVLLDLPDVDSQYSAHLELTRKMLRHMLFPVWVQSIEKYADQQPQKLLAAVAAGNDPANFLFVLNKADQIADDGGGIGAIEELREDFAQRITRTLDRPFAPKVYAVSALKPEGFDLPALSERLSQQKSAALVKHSIELAGRQRDRSMLNWLDAQRLPERVQRLARLQREAEELTASRLSVPLMEIAIPRLLDDPGHRAAIVDEAMNARVAKWPIVNILDTLLTPITGLWRRNVGVAATPESLVDQTTMIAGRTIPATIAATFALLQQTHPMVGPLYRQQRLWEDSAADLAAGELRQSLVNVLERQRTEAMRRFARRGFFMTPIRWLLTIGALLWFPIVQPVLEVMVKNNFLQTIHDATVLAIQILGAAYLLKSVGFLSIYFLALWMILRWDTQRRVTKMLTRWRTLDGRQDVIVNPSAAALAWVDELLDPIRFAREREEALVQRADTLRQELDKPAA